MKTTLEKINEIASKKLSPWKEEAIVRRKNRSWTDRSFKIAVRILREIRKQKPYNGMTQKMLAEEMGVTPQYINKVVKGKENLTLETIAKIEEVLKIRLLEIPAPENSHIIPMIQKDLTVAINRNKATPLIKEDLKYSNKEIPFNSTGTYG